MTDTNGVMVVLSTMIGTPAMAGMTILIMFVATLSVTPEKIVAIEENRGDHKPISSTNMSKTCVVRIYSKDNGNTYIPATQIVTPSLLTGGIRANVERQDTIDGGRFDLFLSIPTSATM